MQPDNESKSGFTLVELLVVIAVISLLMGILMPVINRAKSIAAEKVCASNLRQVNFALIIYAQDDGNGRYPLEPTEHNPHQGLLEKLKAYKDNGLMEAFYCTQDKFSEKFASNPNYVPKGGIDSVIDTPQNHQLGNIGYIYWSFEENKKEADGKTWRDPKYFLPRQLLLTGIRWLANPKPPLKLPKAQIGQQWVMSDFFRKKAPFPHGRKKGSLGGGLNVVFLDGHVDLVKGRPRESYR